MTNSIETLTGGRVTNTIDFTQLYLSEMARHEIELTFLVTVTVGVVALIFAMGVFLVWRENRSIIRAAHSHLNTISSKSAKIDSWYDEKKTSVDAYLKSRLMEFNREVEEMRCYQTVVFALNDGSPHAAIVFPALSVLAERPSALYVGLFLEIIKRGINEDITERAQLGLRRWQEIKERTHGIATKQT